MASGVGTMRRLRLEQLQRLCDDGKRAELHDSIATYSTKELRTLCGGFGVPAQSKEYAAYQSKAGYSELLVKLLEAKTASSAGLTEAADFVPVAGTPSGRTRKTKNCSLRLVNVVFSAAMAPHLAELVDEVMRKKKAEEPSPLWGKVRAEFCSAKPEYARIRYPDDQVFADFNLASPVAHSSEKLQKMWEKLGLAYASVFSQFSEEGDNAVDLAACAGRTDVYYLRRWLSDKPALQTVVCKPTRETDVVLQSVQSLQQIVPQQTLQPSVESAMTHMSSPAMEPVYVNKGEEGERLLKSIKLAYGVLAVMPAADRVAHYKLQRMTSAPLRLYPVFLAGCAIGGFGLCQWYHATDLENRELYHDMSLKYLLTAAPQLLAALLLLYYACTFSRASSIFLHPMLVDSCLHQGVASLMLASLVFSAFHLSLSACCSFPVFCPVGPTACQLQRIVACPESVVHLTHYNLYPRLVHCCATFTMLFALSSIEAACTIKNLNSRVRRAKLATFSRRQPVCEASASVVF
ncbi:hypothetical protein PHYPSEUDO_007213 [Phytophthora pseudosyringae]|uniref:Transmembrane protein n=1 Tax=Phytophthora pseudosyringae TaxID=221518 RepID=A0A8T1VJP7_9STRA|nr:hypothetical protein PHYPSEUDO_007213 [Phytophthora pseudosyringae]